MRLHQTAETVAADEAPDFLGRMNLDFGLRIDCCLDALSCEAGLRRLFQKEYGIPYTLLFAETSYAEMASASPFLLTLEYGHDYLNWLMHEGGKFGFLGLTRAEPKIGHAHWRSLLNTLMPDGAVSHFRFYSCRTLERVLRASSDKEIGWFLGPYAFVMFPAETDEQWTIVTHPAMLPQSEDGEPVGLLAQKIAESYSVIEGTWWQTTDEHLSAFDDIRGNIFRDNLVQFLWLEEGSRAYTAHQAAGSLETFVDECIDRGHKWGFTEPVHVTALTRLYVRHGFTVDTHPSAIRILENAGQDPDGAMRSLHDLFKEAAV
jgi:hypothetical protein